MAVRLTLSLPTLMAVCLAVILVTVATTLIRANTVETIAAQRQPLPVAVTTYDMVDDYERESSYLGTVRAANSSAVGFEIGGQIAELFVSDGDRVDAGTVLATLDTARRQAQRDGAKAQLEKVTTDLSLAEKRQSRTQELVARGLASEQDLDNAVLGAEAIRSVREAARAALRDTELQIDKSTLRAPYNAVVTERLAQAGATVASGMPVIRLIAAADREAHIGVPVNAAKTMSVGESYRLEVAGHSVDVVLGSLRDDLDPTTLTLAAVFLLPSHISVSAGESVKLSVRRRVPTRGGWVPLTALIEGERGLWSILAVTRDGENAVTQRESVEVVYVSGTRAFVRGTLPNGSEIVATGLHRITPGSAIAPLPPQAASESLLAATSVLVKR